MTSRVRCWAWAVMGFGLGLMLVSCSSSGDIPKEVKAERARIAVAAPVVRVEPPPSLERARTQRVGQPQPVFRNPVLTEIGYDAYVNERGELIAPGTKYVVAEPGGWNLDAVRNPGQGYIPPENQMAVPTAPGVGYVPGTASPGSVRKELPSEPRLLFDMEEVRVTGFIGRDDEARARELAGPGEVAVFDERMGWLIVPANVLRGVYNLPSQGTGRKP